MNKVHSLAEFLIAAGKAATCETVKESYRMQYRYLQHLHKNTLPDDVIQARLERLSELKKQIATKITDRRPQWESRLAIYRQFNAEVKEQ